MEKWKSKGLYEHPAKHQAGTFGYIGQSQVGIYYLMVGGSRMSCPQDWAAKIHAEETGQTIPPEDRDKIPVQLRLTPQEYDMLQTQAAAKGLKLAAYLRSLIYEHSKGI